ncbi:hypothetical protein G7Z17_g3543 [Cylindrodendrum hubeiense]|uniref:Uncharacterized protein n=1 Tax=Cylindrodendrum hubeiense TaxID=595255 RepID=A0A9P5LI17_9HYPO|nr:hypothetical protein G7Z17_g3543 [Cylindrodendrum hubeiense]
MSPAPIVHATFSVTSGHLCYGDLENIQVGASTDLVHGLPSFPAFTGGTVMGHVLKFNVPAENGTWAAFQLLGVEPQSGPELVTVESRPIRGWFVCHMDTDPVQEIDKILRVSGSPYEEDSGSRLNNDKTREEGVLVINRYDWGYYAHEREGDDKLETFEDYDFSLNESVGLVDYKHAKDQISQWKDQHPRERATSDDGIWLRIPDGEYKFGRFGYNDKRTAACSFIFFTTNTYFTKTALAGMQHSLRKDETNEERFERRLHEGFDFSGVESMRERYTPLTDPTSTSIYPPPDQLLGPYDPKEHIFRPQDIEAIHLNYPHAPLPPIPGYTYPPRVPAPFVELWKEGTFDVLNEFVLAYLEHSVLPLLPSESLVSLAETLFPNHATNKRVDRFDAILYTTFIEPCPQPIPGFEPGYCESRTKAFLAAHSSHDSNGASDIVLAAICRDITARLAMIVDYSTNVSKDNNRSMIVPSDIRWSIYNGEPLDTLGYSRVFWLGRP